MTRTLVLFVGVVAAACGKSAPAPAPDPVLSKAVDAAVAVVVDAPAAAGSTVTVAGLDVVVFDDLASALTATIPADARVVGFGELHARTDRKSGPSALAQFTSSLSVVGGKVSDLVLETWVVDPKCGAKAQVATAKLETAVKRPTAVKDEVTLLGDAARAQKIQPHAMSLSCKDYDAIAPKSGDADPVAMLTITTRELTKAATAALAKPSTAGGARPWVVLYGGALHNDRFPAPGVEDWSYAAAVDAASGGHYVEVDLVVPELAELDAGSQKQPWFGLAAAAGSRVMVWKRGDRSFVILLPRGAP